MEKIIYYIIVSIIYLFASIGPAAADIITVDFEADAEGALANGFVPTGVSGVSFSDSVGEDLFMLAAGLEGSGSRSLYVGNTLDLSALEISLDFSADFISLDFGNDDPRYMNSGDMAVLTVFQGSTQVGQSTLAVNLDDLMNQTISFGVIGGGTLFDFATFAYTNEFFLLATGGGDVNIGNSEIVDNIQINNVPVPEPSSLVLLTIGIVIGLLRIKPALHI